MTPINIGCFSREHLQTRSHDPMGQGLFQLFLRNFWKSCMKIREAHFCLRIQVRIVESLAEEFDNFAEGKDLLYPRGLVLSRFAGHELSHVCAVIWKMGIGKYGC